MPQGDIVAWSTTEWNLQNMVDEELDLDTKRLCKPFKMGYVLFPEKRNITANLDICHKLKGRIPVVRGKEMMYELLDLYNDHFVDTTTSQGMKHKEKRSRSSFFPNKH